MIGRKSGTSEPSPRPDAPAPPPDSFARDISLSAAFASIAADVCDAPTGIAGMLGESGAWHETVVGGPPASQTGSALREAAFAATGGDAVGERGSAGVALREQTGRGVGTLCVSDLPTRSFSQEDRRALAAVAASLVRAIEVSRERQDVELLPLETLHSALTLVADPIAIFRRGAPGAMPTFVSVNRAFTELFGYTTADVAGKPPSLLAGPDTGTAVRGEILEARSEAPVDHGTLALYTSSGERLLVQMVAHALDATDRILSYRDVTRERAAQTALSDTTLKLQSFVAVNSDAILTFDRNGTCIDANPAAVEMSGYSRAELLDTGFRRSAARHVPSSRRISKALCRGTPFEFTSFVHRHDGRELTVECRAVPIVVRGATDGAYVFAKDVTERRRLALLVRGRAERETALCAIAAIADSSGVDQIDASLELVLRSLDMQHAYVAELVGGQRLIRNVAGEPLEALRAAGRHGFVSLTLYEGERIYGEIGFAWRHNRPYDPADRDFVRLVAATVSATLERRFQDRRLDRLAYFDDLSGLPNRADFYRQLAPEIARPDNRFALHFIDLDGFKLLNDAAGHAVGDLALAEVGRRLAGACSPEACLPARLGGDEFVVLQFGCANHAVATTFGERLVATLSEPYSFDGKTFFMSASLGIAFFPDDGTDAPALMRCADVALYRAKTTGKHRVEVASRGLAAIAGARP